MEYGKGQTLEQAWDTLEHHDQTVLCHELQRACDRLRRLEQEPEKFIGKLRRPLYMIDYRI
ncbi:hypothetical protein ASPZODRAFT_129487 [Penicilliopsis zonata CBS 506.65]|uniref:Uncharacterized protein n=1 Tax=Penicilliopsis zonata CBS 506.65 TaxID=1073090 RepID=A0A1L9SPI7_9EURO|nr:hypothetical protein ASPZODRAFT_129487 [Penicilliopsis zonata CBS 506.65]OJJ49088.1 hypothetical protein ASPZODRAFT_129487 [Penicilliopsis zonata CBS 506.65]